MKHSGSRTILCLLASAALAGAQGTFVFDQQSSDENRVLEGGADISRAQPFGQSFTPSLSSVGFIRLFLYNGILGDTSAATLRVNLRIGSITGQLLAASAPVTVPGGAGFAGPVDFIFAPVTVTPGFTYYFQPVIESNNNIGLCQGPYDYPGGTEFVLGLPDSMGRDLWFREGIVVPEPSAAMLLLLALGLHFHHLRRST